MRSRSSAMTGWAGAFISLATRFADAMFSICSQFSEGVKLREVMVRYRCVESVHVNVDDFAHGSSMRSVPNLAKKEHKGNRVSVVASGSPSRAILAESSLSVGQFSDRASGRLRHLRAILSLAVPWQRPNPLSCGATSSMIRKYGRRSWTVARSANSGHVAGPAQKTIDCAVRPSAAGALWPHESERKDRQEDRPILLAI
jgi:hypothetical protein